MSSSLLDLKSLTEDQVSRLFSLADRLSRETPGGRAHFEHRRGLTAALVFFEPSTRTRLSFETACAREGVHPVVLDSAAGTSLEKGETLEDTLLNVAAMSPAFIVVRCKDGLDLRAMSRRLAMPILNAGWGVQGHPSQALLDAYTIYRRRGSLRGEKILIVGDVRHSRVAASHVELARVMGYELAFAGPRALLPERTDVRTFGALADGLRWANVAMALRVQLERHAGPADWNREEWQLNENSLRDLAGDALIMHPGPINWGVEMSESAGIDSRAVILDQVSGGVLIRQALIRQILEEGA